MLANSEIRYDHVWDSHLKSMREVSYIKKHPLTKVNDDAHKQEANQGHD